MGWVSTGGAGGCLGAPSPWKVFGLHENIERYEDKLLGMWMKFSCDVFHDKISQKYCTSLAIATLSDGLISP